MTEPHYETAALKPLILYSDNHLLALNKPCGLLSQDSGTGQRNLEDWAREWVRVDKHKTGNVFLHAVHRIDKPVSGVVLFARTSKALARLNEEIRSRTCQKTYHARVEGRPEPPEGERVDWLLHGDRKAVICKKDEPGAQRAVLRYRVRKSDDYYSLLEIDLETGRYHQIRVQLAGMGCPIAGDVLYGAAKPSADGSIALHHRRLEITHPVGKERLSIEAPYPTASEWWGDLS